jgi:branched-chain amino acid transport system permease protein
VFSFLVYVLTMGGISGLIALGLNFQAGVSGLLNFGFVAFVGVGGYGAGIAASHGWPLPVGLALGLGAAALLAVAVARLGRNLGTDYWGIATLAVAEIVRTVALNEQWLTGGAQGISGLPPLFHLRGIHADLAFLGLVACCVVIAVTAFNRLTSGRFGRALRLLREEPQMAESFGYRLLNLKMTACVAGAMAGALGGALMAYYISFIGPDSMLAPETFVLWTMVMVGGLGNNFGTVLGAITVSIIFAAVPFLKDLIGMGSDMAGSLRLGLVGVMLLACLIWRPQGLIRERVGMPADTRLPEASRS